MSILDSLIKYRELEERKRNADIEAIPQAVAGFLEARNQAILTELKRQQTEADIRNIESKIEERKSGDVIDDLRNLNIVDDFAKNLALSDPEKGSAIALAARRAGSRLLSGIGSDDAVTDNLLDTLMNKQLLTLKPQNKKKRQKYRLGNSYP